MPAKSGAISIDPASGLKPAIKQRLDTNLACRNACPVGTHAGGYVSLISQGHYREAFLLARKSNPFASICGRICAHPCESGCRRQQIDAPVSIRALKRFITERCGVESTASHEEILKAVERPRPQVEQGGRVAIVGAGPTGLACAHDLALMGHQAVIFDAARVAGGMMRLGIPENRLPRDLIEKEVDFIRFLGVDIRLGVEIGRDVTFKQLRDEYDAVFLAPGCRRGHGLKIPGMETRGVLTAVDFLVNANLGQPLDLGEDILVVGGGNVAFDVARSARRFGGTSVPDEPHDNLMLDAAMIAARTYKRRVTMVSLEARNEMPADLQGISLIHRRGPKEVLGNGRVQALRTVDCSRVFDPAGRFAPEFVDGSDKEIPCDTIIFASGQIADLSFLGDGHGLDLTARNTVAVDRGTLATSSDGIYAGGDVAFGPRIVIEAVADGRRAARSIDTQLTGRDDQFPSLILKRTDTFGDEHPFAAGDDERLDRGTAPIIELARRMSRAEAETGYTEEQARREGARCLHCWVNTIFDSHSMSVSGCMQCGACVDVCPEDCIDLLSLLRSAPEEGLFNTLRLPDGRPLSIIADSGAALIKDQTTCTRCGLCARRCPTGSITMQGVYRADEEDLLRLCKKTL
jgi:NADPH-dependent glutamate synthase beta subunit-like oxidoreductase/NAD-dependent dihydropyrimidine dehydrogenase PreA subunit